MVKMFKQYYGFVSEIWWAAMFVLLMGEIYELCLEIGSGAVIHIPSFIKTG
jgi:hypothetical protein